MRSLLQWGVVFILMVFLLPDFAVASTFGDGRADLDDATSQSGFAYAEPTSVLQRAINYLLSFVGALAILAIIIAGMRLIIGTGNEQQAETAKSILKWAIIGLIIVMFAWVIIRVVLGGLLGVKL